MATVDELVADADSLLKAKDFDGAINKYEEVIALDSRHVQSHETLAGLYFRKKEYGRAAQLFKRVSELNPKNSGALVNAGAALNKHKDFETAVKYLRQALGKDRRCPEAYYNMGIAERGRGQLAMSASAYKEAIRLRPDFIEALSNLGSVLLEMKNNSQAISYFRKALEIQPDFAKAKKGLNKAEEATYQSKQSRNPFGRLVDMEEIEKKNQTVEKSIQLTSTQRYEDRDTVHKISKESELLALDLLKQIKEELSPAVLNISRLATEDQNSRHWAGEQTEYESAVRRFRLRLEKLNEKTDQLRAHEEKIQAMGQ